MADVCLRVAQQPGNKEIELRIPRNSTLQLVPSRLPKPGSIQKVLLWDGRDHLPWDTQVTEDFINGDRRIFACDLEDCVSDMKRQAREWDASHLAKIRARKSLEGHRQVATGVMSGGFLCFLVYACKSLRRNLQGWQCLEATTGIYQRTCSFLAGMNLPASIRQKLALSTPLQVAVKRLAANYLPTVIPLILAAICLPGIACAFYQWCHSSKGTSFDTFLTQRVPYWLTQAAMAALGSIPMIQIKAVVLLLQVLAGIYVFFRPIPKTEGQIQYRVENDPELAPFISPSAVIKELNLDFIDFVCPIARVIPHPSQLVYTICGHVFDAKYLEDWLKETTKCPVCRVTISWATIRPWEEGAEILSAILEMKGESILDRSQEATPSSSV